MIYNNQSHITPREDVEKFETHILNDLGIMFRPDDDFAKCINYTTGLPCFAKEETAN